VNSVIRKSWPVAILATAILFAAENGAKPSYEQMEQFLKTAKVLKIKDLSTGIAHTQRATLADDKMQHDAHIQNIDEAKAVFQGDRGTEMNFRDTWKFNVAAYRLGLILGLDMIPPSVERKIGGKDSAVTWWVDDSMMEIDRQKKKLESPDRDAWNREMHVVRVFDQLIYNTDRNLQNLVITTDWRIWMIDHTRAFRMSHDLENSKNLSLCERRLLSKMKELDRSTLQSKLHTWVGNPEIDGLLARRDAIVNFFDKEAAAKGEAMVYYELPPRE